MIRLTLSSCLLALSFFACGPDNGGNTNMSSSQTCMTRHGCINGSCTCSEGPKKDSSCCDPNDSSCTVNKCDTFCRYCQ